MRTFEEQFFIPLLGHLPGGTPDTFKWTSLIGERNGIRSSIDTERHNLPARFEGQAFHRDVYRRLEAFEGLGDFAKRLVGNLLPFSNAV